MALERDAAGFRPAGQRAPPDPKEENDRSTGGGSCRMAFIFDGAPVHAGPCTERIYQTDLDVAKLLNSAAARGRAANRPSPPCTASLPGLYRHRRTTSGRPHLRRPPGDHRGHGRGAPRRRRERSGRLREGAARRGPYAQALGKVRRDARPVARRPADHPVARRFRLRGGRSGRRATPGPKGNASAPDDGLGVGAPYDAGRGEFSLHPYDQNLGPWSPIHFLSIFTLAVVPLAVLQARQHNVTAHRSTMIWIFTLALVVTGLFTLAPGRIMNKVVFGG